MGKKEEMGAFERIVTFLNNRRKTLPKVTYKFYLKNNRLLKNLFRGYQK